MEHRGEILGRVLKRLDVKYRSLARQLGVHHNTISNYVDRADLSDDLLLHIGEIIRHDMAIDFSSLARLSKTPSPADSATQLIAGYGPPDALETEVPASLPECQKALMNLQARYINFMQEHIILLRQVARTSVQAA